MFLMSDIDANDLKEEWEQSGCMVLPQFLSNAELEELRAHTESYLKAHQQKVSWSYKASKFQGTIKGLQEADPWFDQLLLHGSHVELLKVLLDDELEPATAAYFDRVVGETQGIEPHFDAIGHRRLGATIWFALDPSDKENGCLHYDRGSHRIENSHVVGIEGYNKAADSVLPVELKPGDAAIHSSLTVHWSEPNQSKRSRRAISLFYWAKNSRKQK